jgi:hypothetical protein
MDSGICDPAWFFRVELDHEHVNHRSTHGDGMTTERTKKIADKYVGRNGERPDEALLTKLNAAVAEHNVAEQAVTTAQADLLPKAKALGQLLLEAKKLHPKVKDFEAFLKRVNGLKLSRAYDLLRLAGGRTTDAELREDAAERQRKHRAKKKLPKPEPLPDSVTDADVTESPRITASPEISADERREQFAALDDDLDYGPEEQRRVRSKISLADFKRACAAYLPGITDPDDRTDAMDAFSLAMHAWNTEQQEAA